MVTAMVGLIKDIVGKKKPESVVRSAAV
jgi:hypothetical protein